MTRRHLLWLAAAPALRGQPLPTASLRPQTLEEYQNYIRSREEVIDREQIRGANFLWVDRKSGYRERALANETLVEPVVGRGVREIRGGLIHDWIGASFVPGVSVSQVLALVKNYDNHKNIYQPEVADSKILQRRVRDDFRIHLRLVKKKVITVVLNTEHEVRYYTLDAARVHSRSYSTRIAEVDSPGPGERELTPGDDHGLLWRLDTWWRFFGRDGGVWIECEAASLTRGVPTGLGWLINPIVRELPRESLENTLKATRRALAG